MHATGPIHCRALGSCRDRPGNSLRPRAWAYRVGNLSPGPAGPPIEAFIVGLGRLGFLGAHAESH